MNFEHLLIFIVCGYLGGFIGALIVNLYYREEITTILQEKNPGIVLVIGRREFNWIINRALFIVSLSWPIDVYRIVKRWKK